MPEPGDADAEATALREAREEIGLHPGHVEVLGRLPAYTTVTRFVVTPVVALVHRRSNCGSMRRRWRRPSRCRCPS
jgi:8-oxo-dGTP pyrophosphatase MutT (NUDIX family)